MWENLAKIISSLSASIHSRTGSNRWRDGTLLLQRHRLRIALNNHNPKMRSLFTRTNQFVKTKAHSKADPLSSPLSCTLLFLLAFFSVSRLSFLTFLAQICCFYFL